MDEHTQMMKALHEKMMSATTPEARQIVMERQREEMQGCMATMNQMKQGGYVSLASGEAAVQYDERLTSPEQLKSAVTAAGYGVGVADTVQKSKGKACCCG